MKTYTGTKRLVRAAGACVLAGTLAGAARAQAPRPGPGLGVDTANFDRGVRPQDDFFRFVNGGWLRGYKLPEDRSNYGSFSELTDRSDSVIRRIVEEAAASHAAPGSDAQKVGDFYAAFMDTARAERVGLTPLRPELARISAVTSKAQLPALFAHLYRMGVQVPFAGFVVQDDRKADEYVVAISQSGLGLPDRDYYLNQDPKFAEARAAYQTYAETLLRLAGQPNPAAAARGIVALETSLARAQWEKARNRDPQATYNRFTLAQLDGQTPAFSWTAFVHAAGAERSPWFVVRQPSYLAAFNTALAQTPLSTWKQYLAFKLVHEYAPDLSSPFVNANFAFIGHTLGGLEQNQPRWKRGVDEVESSMGMLSGKLYIERTFNAAAKARMQQLVQNLMAAFRQGIDELAWMSPETRTRAQQKLASFTVKIAYPDKWQDFSALTVRPGDLVGNVIRANQYTYDYDANKLGKPVDRTEWGMTPQTVNAYYNPVMNEIVFPAAILQPPFFNPNADDATNYGAIGGVIGHEMSHGFDDQGRQYDPQGNLSDWWTPADAEAFKTRADALVAEYSSFNPIPGMNVNGRLTLGENIGDLSGLTVAYRAYKMSHPGEAPVIDGFTADQRFFLGWAQVWRRAYREANIRQRLLTDPHALSEYRVNGVLRNMPEFYAAFNVQPGDKMYVPPEQRVKIW
jgi:putative endopeptidase